MKSIRIALLGLLLSFGAQAAEINDLNITDSSNTARFPEGMAAGDVNDSARALEGLIARWYADENCSVASTGSSNTYAMAANQTLGAYYDGLVVCFDANHSNTGAATLNVDTLGAKTIKKYNDQDVESGDIDANQKVLVVYDGTNFQLLSAVSAGNFAVTDADNSFTADQTIVDTDTGAAEGPALDLHRDSSSPAISDLTGALRYKGEDTTSAVETYAKVGPAQILDPNNGSEDGSLAIATIVAGTLDDRFHFGQGLYAEGNTDPGVGNIDADGFLISGVTVETTSLDTEQATSSGNSKTFTDPFSTVTEFEIMLEDVSLDGTTDEIGIRIGDSGGLETSGYDCVAGFPNSFPGELSTTEGQVTAGTEASDTWSGTITGRLKDATNNTWIMEGTLWDGTASNQFSIASCVKSLSAALTQLAVLVTGTPTDAFDDGSVNVRWRGY